MSEGECSSQDYSLTSLWSTSANSSILCVSSNEDGSQIAVGTINACLVLDARTGERIFQSDKSEGPVNAVAFTREGHLLIGAQGSLRLWDIASARTLASLDLLDKSKGQEDRNCSVILAAQPGGELLSVASEHGRNVYIVKPDLSVESELELQPNCGSLSEFSWLSSTALLATTHGGLQGWLYRDKTQPALVLGKSIGLMAASVAPEHSTLAAGSKDGVVYLWTLVESDSQSGADALSAELRSTLKNYRDEVQVLRWDAAGRYLATADGSEATIWDVPRLFEQPVHSNICCGHEPNSQILCAAFQQDGSFLATGGSDGKVLFYNAALFQAGQVCQPCATGQNIPSGDGIVCVKWLPGGQLVAGTQAGKVIGWQLQASALTELNSIKKPMEKLTLEADPTADRHQGDTSSSGTSMNGFAKRPQLKTSNSAKFTRPELAARASSSMEGSTSSSSGRLARPSRKLHRDDSNNSLAAERNLSLPNSRSVREATERMRTDSMHPESSEGLAAMSRSQSLQETGQALGRRATSLERQQLSPSLMQHIQRVQQKPTATNRQREPAGWGMGSPNSAPSTSQMQIMGHGGMVPFNAPPGHMQPGFMMFSNQPGMGGQGMVSAYGFPPTMAPMPMMPHAQQPGMAGGKPLSGMAPGMMYMPMGNPGVAQQQWQMMQGPWMGHFFMHPSQRPGLPLPEHLGILSSGRSSSAPDGDLAFNSSARPTQTSDSGEVPNPVPDHAQLPNPTPDCAELPNPVPGSMQDIRQDLSKNAISLPLTNEWRRLRTSSEKPQPELPASHSASAKRPPGSPAWHASQEPRHGVQDRVASEAGRSWTSSPDALQQPPSCEPVIAEEGELEHAGTDSGNPVVTVYVGNLPPSVDELALMVPFSYFGTITNIQVIRDKNSYQSRGFAFVSYSQPMFATAAIQNMNGRILYGSFRGRALKVGPSNRIP